MRSEELELISKFARRKWGLVIDDRKRVIVENRLHGLRRTHPVDDVASLVRTLEFGTNPDLELALFDALSTNHTHFFREDAHFDLIRDQIIKPARSKPGGLRIWSAGCSRGCEPYTLSILLHESLDDPMKRGDRILATDLSTGALAAARAGEYSLQEVADVTPERLRSNFTAAGDAAQTKHRILPHIRGPVSFHMLNLLESWPMNGPFDVVLCRNVMIYFDAETRKRLAERFLRLVRPGGLLFVGTSETLSDFGLGIEQLSVGAYRKPGGTS